MIYASEASKLPSVPAKISWHSSVKEMVPEDSCSDGIRLCVTKNNREIPDCSLFPISNLHPRGFAVSSILPETSALASSHFQGVVIVSVPGPGLSPDILYRCSCVRSGGETFLRPAGPSAVQPLSHIAY
jgi:hypothetical protein